MMHSRRAWALTVTALIAGAGAPVASAAPQGFPDINGFTDVTASYTIPSGRGNPSVMFSTPDGLSCGFAAAGDQSAHCDGALPGVSNIPVSDDRAGDCDLGGAASNPPGIWHHRAACNSHSAGNKVLNPGQKVAAGAITCGVAAGGVTACLDTAGGEHGFVLQPSGSWSF